MLPYIYQAEWTKGFCHVWSRDRRFSPSLPGDRYLKLGSKSGVQAEISGASFGTTPWHHVQRFCCFGILLTHEQLP